MLTLHPANLRFTQDAISCHFKKPYEDFRVREALAKIQAGTMSPEVFPKLRVISHNGLWWSVDNRRLWVFRMANCPEISVRVIVMHQRLQDVISVPSRLRRLSKAAFLPKVREGQSIQALNNNLPPRVAEMMARINRSGFSADVPAAIPKSLSQPTAVSTDPRNVGKGIVKPGSNSRQAIQFGSLQPTAWRVTREGFVTATGINARTGVKPKLLPLVSEAASDGRSPRGAIKTQPSREPQPRPDHIVCSLRQIGGSTRSEQSPPNPIGLTYANRSNLNIGVTQSCSTRAEQNQPTPIGLTHANRSKLNIGAGKSGSAGRTSLTDQATIVHMGLRLHQCRDEPYVKIPATNSGLGWLRRVVLGCFGCG